VSAQIGVRAADDPETFADFRALLSEYFAHLVAEWPNPDPERWQREVDSLPGTFARPQGRMLVAYEGGRPTGIVALTDLGEGACEVKRLYVRPAARRKGVSRALMDAVFGEAREAGYDRMLLGTGPSFVEAIALYESLGFERTARFRAGFTEHAVFMVRELE
jgi:ribosomal protein S18 acetylase RimI-like enzyme